MAARRLLAGCSRSRVCSLSTIFRAHDSMVSSILLIQTRPKMSKTSPFPKRSNPMKKDRQAMIKSMPGMMKGNDDRKMDRPMLIDSPGMIFSSYLPIRRFHFFTPKGIKERWNAFKNGLWTIYSLAHVRKHCKPFKLKEFGQEAQNIYVGVNNALVSKDKQKLQDLATSSVYLSLRKEYFTPDKNIHWRYVSTLSRPKVVHVRANPVGDKSNVFAQITVKLHSKQVFAIKDKHGRHVSGSDKQVKEVVDFVVFERHLTNKYGKWKVCGKLIAPVVMKRRDTAQQKLTGKNVPSV